MSLFTEPDCPYRLKPFTSYKFRVKATNDIGDSEFSEESEPLTTLQAGQCPPNSDLFLLALPGHPRSLPRGGASKAGHPVSGSLGRVLRRSEPEGPSPQAQAPKPTHILMVSFSGVPKLIADPGNRVKRFGGGPSGSRVRSPWLQG